MNIPSKVVRLFRWADPSHTRRYGRQGCGEVASTTRQRRYVCTHVVTGEVVDVALSKHGIVLELRLAKRRGVSGDDNELGLSRSERLEGALVSKGD